MTLCISGYDDDNDGVDDDSVDNFMQNFVRMKKYWIL